MPDQKQLTAETFKPRVVTTKLAESPVSAFRVPDPVPTEVDVMFPGAQPGDYVEVNKDGSFKTLHDREPFENTYVVPEAKP